MKRIVLLVFMVLLASAVFAQWIHRTTYTDAGKVEYFINFEHGISLLNKPATLTAVFLDDREYGMIDLGVKVKDQIVGLQVGINGDLELFDGFHVDPDMTNFSIWSNRFIHRIMIASAIREEVVISARRLDGSIAYAVFDSGDFLEIYAKYTNSDFTN